jgi:Ner family transcriptional regulator
MRRDDENITRNIVLDQEQKFVKANDDWSAARVKYELEMRGRTLTDLSRDNQFHVSAAGKALRTSWPEMERIIAEALGVEPKCIWPSRYTEDGIPRKYLARTKRDPRSGRS